MRNTQRMPFKTARRLFHGLLRPSARRFGSGIKSSKISQCSSVISRAVAAGIDVLSFGRSNWSTKTVGRAAESERFQRAFTVPVVNDPVVPRLRSGLSNVTLTVSKWVM